MSNQRVVVVGGGTAKEYRAAFMGFGLKDGRSIAILEKVDGSVVMIDPTKMKFVTFNPALGTPQPARRPPPGGYVLGSTS